MPRLRAQLASATDPDWVQVILDNFDDFLIDHASCERKAMAYAMSVIVKYPDRTEIIPDLLQVAQDELDHFRDVLELMEQRGLQMIPDEPDPYVNQLIKICRHGRDERLLDRLLVASVIETRGAERFRIIAEALEDAELKEFYRNLWATEAKHGDVFRKMASHYFSETEIEQRSQEITEAEAEIMVGLKWRASLH
ncbi:MAG: tRNA-(ms[2]io[6]A)-hydroxylase [Gammaproteobacteria bacterium]|nr:tRNA-(ms[2]io[6]A)-hydroxylase [Gammaproteobacteria bacterium]